MPALEDAVYRFLDAVETVFHSDWEYTRSSTFLYLTSGDSDARRKRRDQPTLLAPKMGPHELEAQNWGNYEVFLERYKELCAALGREPIV